MNIENLLKQKQNVLYDILPNATLGMCVEILNERRIGALLVRDSQGNLEGIITERDIMRTMSAHHGQVWDIQVNEVMTPWGRIISAAPDEPIQAIMERMTSNRIRHIPVMDGGKIIGLISIGDVVKILLEQALEENEQMKEYIYGRYAVGQ